MQRKHRLVDEIPEGKVRVEGGKNWHRKINHKSECPSDTSAKNKKIEIDRTPKNAKKSSSLFAQLLPGFQQRLWHGKSLRGRQHVATSVYVQAMNSTSRKPIFSNRFNALRNRRVARNFFLFFPNTRSSEASILFRKTIFLRNRRNCPNEIASVLHLALVHSIIRSPAAPARPYSSVFQYSSIIVSQKNWKIAFPACFNDAFPSKNSSEIRSSPKIYFVVIINFVKLPLIEIPMEQYFQPGIQV